MERSEIEVREGLIFDVLNIIDDVLISVSGHRARTPEEHRVVREAAEKISRVALNIDKGSADAR